MFKSMRLKNFKAYKDSGEVPLAPLTIIVGVNNSGKSTLFHALLALAQTARAAEPVDTSSASGLHKSPRLVTKGDLVDLNGYYDIIHGRGRAKTSFEISVGIKDFKWGFDIPNQVDLKFRLNEELNEIALTSSTLRGGFGKLLNVERRQNIWSFVSQAPLENAQVGFRSVFPFIQPVNGANSTEKIFKEFVVPTYYAADFWWVLFLSRINHIGSLRERVPWYAAIGSRSGSKFGSGGENLVSDLASDEKDRYLKKTQLQFVNDWFANRKVMKRVYLEVGKEANVRMLVGDEFTGPTKVNVAAMGEGVSQILPIIAYSKFGMNDDCLLIEEPESHVHPALQAELGELFIEISQTGHRQILVETHSEYLVMRVRRRVAEGKLDPKDVAILFVEKQGSESTVRRLNMTERGHFPPGDWPAGFFDEAYQESKALAMAANRKGR